MFLLVKDFKSVTMKLLFKLINLVFKVKFLCHILFLFSADGHRVVTILRNFAFRV